MMKMPINVHWFRRAFKALGAAFLFFYLLPDAPGYLWPRQAALTIGFVIFMILVIVEILRLRGVIPHSALVALRSYEEKRPASYLFFGAGVFLLLAFFPQQIAVPCILCVSFGDVVMGEVRLKTKNNAYSAVAGFLTCVLFFVICQCPLLIVVIGAFAAVIGELAKSPWIDDDLLMQLLPALLLLLMALAGIWTPEQIISAYPPPEWLPAGKLW